MAAIALLITGAITSEIVDRFVYQEVTGALLTRSRLWWEIVLNLQILSVGMIWFCYSDRIADATGNLKRMHMLLCGITIIAALIPSFLAAVSAANNWFYVRPSLSSFIGFFVFGIAFWFTSLLMQIVLFKLRARLTSSAPKQLRVWHYIPAILLALIVAIDGPLGGRLWLVATPVLLYLQGAMPYLVHAFGPVALSEPKID